MNIVYNCDDRFASVFATSVTSLFENNQEEKEITVYLIEDHLSYASKAKIQEIAAHYNRQIVLFPMPDLEKLVGVDVVIPNYNRMATCGRLFVASLLPAEVEKVIYLDCDTVVLQPLSELWDFDLQAYPVAMTDCAQNRSFRTQLGLRAEGTYYNSGVILANLKQWRACNAEEKFLSFIQQCGGYIPFPDEGVLNAVFDGNILTLPLKFNAITQIFAFSYDEMLYVRGLSGFYSPEEVENAKREPVVVHFTSNFYMPLRPWVKGCTHPYAQKYLAYRALTPWRDAPLWDDPRSSINKAYTQACYVLPKPISMWMSRIITVHITPVRHQINMRKALKKMRAQTANLPKNTRGGVILLFPENTEPLSWPQPSYRRAA